MRSGSLTLARRDRSVDSYSARASRFPVRPGLHSPLPPAFPRGGPEVYFGVLDGHGGAECAEFAYPLLSVAVSQSLAEEVRSDPKGVLSTMPG